jgi:hypothetical protein
MTTRRILGRRARQLSAAVSSGTESEEQSVLTGIGRAVAESAGSNRQLMIAAYNEPPDVAQNSIATHWAYVINEDYDFSRTRQLVKIYSKFPYIDNKPIASIEHKTLLQIVEENIGVNNSFHKVKILSDDRTASDIEGMISIQNIKVLPSARSQMLPVSFKKCKQGAPYNIKIEDLESDTSPEWYKTEEPFFNQKLCNYYVCIDTVHTNTGGELFESRKQEAIGKGISYIFNFYNKHLPEKDLKKYLSNPMFAKAESWYLDPDQPESNLKILVSIGSKYFDAIADADIRPSDLEGAENGIARVVTFDSSEMRDRLEKIVSKFRFFEKDHRWRKYKHKYTGPVEKGYGIINFDDEASHIEMFFAALQKFLKTNGASLRENESDRVEIGFSQDFEIKYIFYDDGAGAKALNKGLFFQKQREPFNLIRTCGYIFYSYEMTKEHNGLTWMQVLKGYTYPKPELKPSSNKCRDKFHDKLACIEHDKKLENYNKARRDHEECILPVAGKPLKERDPEEIVGLTVDFKDKNKPAKVVSLIPEETADASQYGKSLDKKMDSHYDKVEEDFISFILPELRKFALGLFGTNPLKDMTKFSHFSQIYIDMITKMPSQDRLLSQAHQIACLQLERTKQQFEDRNNTSAAQNITTMENALSCKDACKAMPILCSPEIACCGSSFPPRFDLPEVPTVDIMRVAIEKIEGFLISSILESVVQMAISTLESMVDQGSRLNFDDLNLKSDFLGDINASLDDEKVRKALLESGININNVAETLEPETDFMYRRTDEDLQGIGSDVAASGVPNTSGKNPSPSIDGVEESSRSGVRTTTSVSDSEHFAPQPGGGDPEDDTGQAVTISGNRFLRGF